MGAAPQSPGQRRLLAALKVLRRLQNEGRRVVRTSDITRLERESLVANGFLAPVVQGWYMPTKPGEADGNSTSWYAAARDFIGGYCDARFGEQWCVAADLSVRLHTGETSLPKQVSIQSPSGQNSLLKLPWGCSIVDIKAKDFPSPAQLTRIGPLRAMKLEHALVRVPESFFHAYAQDAQLGLASLRDASDITRELLDGGRSVVAGRIAGALRVVGRGDLADEVLATMREVGYTVVESNPFDAPLPQLVLARGESPYAARIRLMWASMRPVVLDSFPPEPGAPQRIERYMADVEDVYVTDAYHSLSIEGYRVSDELIERVARGDWNPETHTDDADARNAMAAHGYWHAHNAVKDSIRQILTGANPGRVAQRDHREWYRRLFAPSVDAGILRPTDLAGYRGHQVYIRNAAHVPPPVEAVRDMMPVLFELLEQEPSAAVRAVVGHFVFVFIHPYMDGNGRIGRFLMNVMLASGGYPWTVLRLERRNEYMEALNSASSKADMAPFARFIASSVGAAGEAVHRADTPKAPQRRRRGKSG